MMHDVTDCFPCKREEMDFLLHGQLACGNRVNVDQKRGTGPRVVALNQQLQRLQ